MTAEAQSILIAEACGYSVQECLDGLIEWRNPNGGYLGRYPAGECPSVVPKYTTDLNAMRDAEQYASQNYTQFRWSKYRDAIELAMDEEGMAFLSTAAQRAEAFLRTLNLWRDDA